MLFRSFIGAILGKSVFYHDKYCLDIWNICSAHIQVRRACLRFLLSLSTLALNMGAKTVDTPGCIVVACHVSLCCDTHGPLLPVTVIACPGSHNSYLSWCSLHSSARGSTGRFLSATQPCLPCRAATGYQVCLETMSGAESLVRCVMCCLKVSYYLILVPLCLTSSVNQVRLYTPSSSSSCYAFCHWYGASSINVDSC